MQKTSLPSVQKMIFKTLSKYEPLMNEVDGVFTDSVVGNPQKYISIGEDTVNDWSNCVFYGEEVTHTLHVWHSGSSYECKQIMSLVIEALTQPSLVIDDGFYIEKVRLDFLQVIDDPENWRHGIVRFRFLISQ